MLATCLLFSGTVLFAAITGDLRIAALRVAFQSDDSPGTSGDGTFLLTMTDSVCGRYTIDPPPHDRAYFQSQLKAVDTYYRSVSGGKFGIDLQRSTVFPPADTASYHLAQTMSYYHPFDAEELYNTRLTELLRDAIQVAFAADSIAFSDYDLVVVFHAGVGQDFSLPYLDPTPEDIPSTFVDQYMIRENLGVPEITVGGYSITQGVILPETQNHLFFQEAADIFLSADEPCDYQFGLTGTFALMIGFAVGLPPLWDTESGMSGIGIFGLMDQGSNNGRGLIPAPPDAWSRIYAGWETPQLIYPDAFVSLPARPRGGIIQVAIDDDEYFLIENRTHWFRDRISIDSLRYVIYQETSRYPPYVEILFDEVALLKDTNGVVIGVPDYDLGLPASGLLIWHIDESRIQAGIDDYRINHDGIHGVDLEEADGAQDLGYPSIHTFFDPSSGYFGDMWFQGNLEYERANPSNKGQLPVFGPHTIPDTRSNSGAATYLKIDRITAPGDTATFFVTNDFLVSGFPDTSLHLHFFEDFNGDSRPELIGGRDTLWWSPMDTLQKHWFYQVPGKLQELVVTNYDSSYRTLVVFSSTGNGLNVSGFHYVPIENNLVLAWEQSVDMDSLGFVQGYRQEERVDILYPDGGISVFPDTVVSWDYTEGDLNLSKITITYTGSDTPVEESAVMTATGGIAVDNGAQYPPWLEGRERLIYLSAVDLDLDGKAEFVTLAESGDVYVFNTNLSLLSGFPVSVAGVPPILNRNLFGDDHPELVLRDTTGDLVILNWRGELQYRLSNPQGSALRMLADYSGRSAMVTEAAVWHFDSLSVDDGNEWPMAHHNTLNRRELHLQRAVIPIDQTTLLDAARTYAYPNPAKDGKVIFRVFVVAAEKISVTIYDLAGYYVTTLRLDNPVLGETNELMWKVNNMESGVYFARVTASRGNRQASKLLKVGVLH
jgi:hypothetical protein